MNRRAGTRAAPEKRDERGSTLIEVLVALVITSSAIFVLVGGMSALFSSSIQNRQTTTSGVVARNYAEALGVAVGQASAAAVAGAWCATSYSVASTPPTGFTIAAAYGACPANNATTPQFQTVVITTTAPNLTTEKLRIVVRKT
jgi:type II secretory pathway pseudopilin PulG